MPQLVSHKAPKRYCLLSLMSIFMIGSAVWLKLILFAELWETPQHDILYERQRTECGERCHQNGRNGAPPFDVAEGLRLSRRGTLTHVLAGRTTPWREGAELVRTGRRCTPPAHGSCPLSLRDLL